jgi:hypothetical protein
MKTDPTSTNAHTSVDLPAVKTRSFYLFSFRVNMVYKKRLSFACVCVPVTLNLQQMGPPVTFDPEEIET